MAYFSRFASSSCEGPKQHSAHRSREKERNSVDIAREVVGKTSNLYVTPEEGKGNVGPRVQ